MSEDIVEVLEAFRVGLLRADGDRDLGFQSNITTNASMAIADALKASIDTIEALRGEVERLTKERDEALKGDVLQMMRSQTKRAEKAEAEAEALRGEVERLDEARKSLIAEVRELSLSQITIQGQAWDNYSRAEKAEAEAVRLRQELDGVLKMIGEVPEALAGETT